MQLKQRKDFLMVKDVPQQLSLSWGNNAQKEHGCLVCCGDRVGNEITAAGKFSSMVHLGEFYNTLQGTMPNTGVYVNMVVFPAWCC